MKTLTYKAAVNYDQDVVLNEERHWALTHDNYWLSMLRRFPSSGVKYRNPVVLVHGFGQNSYSWDLKHRSFQNYLVSKGFDTYNIELRGHSTSRSGNSPYPKSFSEYYEIDIPAILNEVSAISGSTKCHIIGHSLGGSIAYASGVRFPDKIKSIITIGTATHFGKVSTVNRYIAKSVLTFFEKGFPGPYLLNKIPYVFGDIAGRVVKLSLWYFDKPENIFPLAVWYPKSMERELIEQRVTDGFDRTGVPVFLTLMRWFATEEGNFSDDGNINYSEEMSRFNVPIFFVVGNKDKVASLESIQPGYDMVPISDKKIQVFGDISTRNYGHIDLILGKYAPIDTWPPMSEWLINHSLTIV